MKVLLIGAGMVAETHVLALRDNTAGARLIGALGRDKTRTATFCARAADTLGHPIAALTDLDAAIAMVPDMAILITPPNALSLIHISEPTRQAESRMPSSA